MSRCSCLALLLLAEGCWTRSRRLDRVTPIRRADRGWIWSRGQGVRWHDVVMSPDSVSGIPYGLSACDQSRRFPPPDCWRSIPTTEVDSIVDVRPGVTQYVAGAALVYALFRWVV